MGRRTTNSGYQRWRNNSDNPAQPANGGPSAAVAMMCVRTADITATQSSATRVNQFGANAPLVLPKGAMIRHVITESAGGTGGVTPTYDLGLEGVAVDSIVNEGDVDTASNLQVATGTGLNTALTTDRFVTGGAGASAATGGTFRVAIFFTMLDDGSLAN